MDVGQSEGRTGEQRGETLIAIELVERRSPQDLVTPSRIAVEEIIISRVSTRL